ncbi:MAG: pentapeptide repeat-containing protein, partial [Nocardioides sp.]
MAATFHERDLAGANFDDVSLRNASFHRVAFDGSRFSNVDLVGVTMENAALIDVDITAEVRNLVINGIDVAPYVEAELDKQQPGR